LKNSKSIIFKLIVSNFLVISGTISGAEVIGAQNIPGVLYVNKANGPYTTIMSAINALRPGGVVEITDNSVYYEKITIPSDLHNITIKASEGFTPTVSGEALNGADSVITISVPTVTIDGLGVYVGGAQYGIKTTAGPVNIVNSSFDLHVASRGGTSTWAIGAGGDLNVLGSNFIGPDSSQSSGGIISQGSTVLHISVSNSDFWGLGTTGGVIGTALPSGSTMEVVGNVFGQSPNGSNVVGINSWGQTGLIESHNSFRNIFYPISGNFGSLDSTDVVTGGSVSPSISYISDNSIISDSVLASLGCPVTGPIAYYPTRLDLEHILDRVIISDYYDLYSDAVPSSVAINQILDVVKPRVWQQFSATWGRQLDESYWLSLNKKVQSIRSRPDLKDLLFGGYLMEAVEKGALNSTPIPHDLWLSFAYFFPKQSARPLVAKIVNGHRVQAHWFDYDSMSGYGANAWGVNYSVPNLKSWEGVLYYIFASKEFINSGINLIQIAQPQLTFGQGYITPNSVSSHSFSEVTKFIKYYGSCFGQYSDGVRFSIVGVASIYDGFRNDSNYVDYTMTPAGADIHGAGIQWNALGDAFNTLPPDSIRIGNKPHLVQLDNFGPKDHMTTFAKAGPAERNAWLVKYDSFVRGSDFHFAMPAFRPIVTDAQNFSGYSLPSAGMYRTDMFLPLSQYGGPEAVEADIFSRR
jgi:hypothetical protein